MDDLQENTVVSVRATEARTEITADAASRGLGVGDLIADRYEIVSELGKGGAGVVYKVRQVFLNKTLALKMLLHEGSSANHVARFHLEAKAASRLEHPNLVPVVDFGIWKENTPYLVMEFFEGQTLSELIKSKGRLPLREAIDLFIQVCDAISYTHAQAVIHRDIKPSNILVSPGVDNRTIARILDFGISKITYAEAEQDKQQHLTRTGEIFGSPLYMSPEQARGQTVDCRSDLYSLGCTLVEALTGVPPYVGKTALDTMMQHQSARLPTLKEASMGMEFPEALEALIPKLLEKDFEKRIESAEKVRQVLVDIRDSNTPKSIMAVPSSLKSSTSGSLVLLNLLALLTVALVFYNFRTKATIIENVESAPTAIAELQMVDKANRAIYKSDETAREFVARVVKRPAEIDLSRPDAPELKNEDLQPIANAVLAKRIILTDQVLIDDRALKNLENLQHLSRLDLAGTSVSDVSSLVNLKSSLIHLDVSSTQLDLNGARVLGELRNLTNLDISNNAKISDQALPYFYRLTGLRRLKLKNCDLKSKAIDLLQAKLPNCSIDRTSVDKDLTMATALAEQGGHYFKAGNARKSIDYYKDALAKLELDMHVERASIYLMEGSSYEALGNIEDAAKCRLLSEQEHSMETMRMQDHCLDGRIANLAVLEQDSLSLAQHNQQIGNNEKELFWRKSLEEATRKNAELAARENQLKSEELNRSRIKRSN